MKANTKRAMEEARLDTAIMCCFYTAILALNGRFGFGKKRLQEFTDEFGATMRDYFNRYDEVTMDALRKHCEEKGIRVDTT